VQVVDTSDRDVVLVCWERVTGERLPDRWRARLVMSDEARSLAHYPDHDLLTAGNAVRARTGELRLVAWLRQARGEPPDDTHTSLRTTTSPDKRGSGMLRSVGGRMPQRPVDSDFHLPPPMLYTYDT
jgi:hypothetical protein